MTEAEPNPFIFIWVRNVNLDPTQKIERVNSNPILLDQFGLGRHVGHKLIPLVVMP